MIHRAFCILFLSLFLHGCGESAQPTLLVHTSFSEASGLTVVVGTGKPQQLIEESLGVNAAVSANGQWIVVEDMQLSDLVVIRAFQYTNDGYRETPIAEIRLQWETLAHQAGLSFEDLMHPRVGFEEFGSSENTALLHFQADTGIANNDRIDSVVEIQLNR